MFIARRTVVLAQIARRERYEHRDAQRVGRLAKVDKVELDFRAAHDIDRANGLARLDRARELERVHLVDDLVLHVEFNLVQDAVLVNGRAVAVFDVLALQLGERLR